MVRLEILLISRISFSTKILILIYFLSECSSRTGTCTICYFYTIFYIGPIGCIRISFGNWISFYNSNKNNSICYTFPDKGTLLFNIRSSRIKLSKDGFKFFVTWINFNYWCLNYYSFCTVNKSDDSEISWTYFKTSTICGMITIFYTIFSRICGI